MEIPARRKKFASRSREGCLECRDCHQKCDENRPVCGLCNKMHRKCTYQLRLSWSRRQHGNTGQHPPPSSTLSSARRRGNVIGNKYIRYSFLTLEILITWCRSLSKYSTLGSRYDNHRAGSHFRDRPTITCNIQSPNRDNA